VDQAADDGRVPQRQGGHGLRRAARLRRADRYYAALPATHKGFQARPFPPFGHDGGKPVTRFDNKAFDWIMLAKADEKRPRTVLKVCDFLASPFGTEERLPLSYGVEGTDHHWDPHGNPILTAKGNQDAPALQKHS
jgi:hypothetical protein